MRALLLLPLMAACAPVAPDPAGGPATDACGASGYRSLIGSNIGAVTLPASLNHRVIGPGDVVTMDFVAERLNLWVSGSGEIERVTCG